MMYLIPCFLSTALLNACFDASVIRSEWYVAAETARQTTRISVQGDSKLDKTSEDGKVALVARDTWAIEQLQRQHVDSFLRDGQPDQALSAAKSLFLVSGIGSTQYCIHKLVECLRAARPGDPSIATFKLQQLALASSDPALRAKQSKDLGENVLAGIPIDPKPFAKAIEALAEKTDYDSLYAKGNLLLLSGRVPEARQAFEAAYKAAPPNELSYATQGILKVIKAEDLSIGRMNQTILELRSRQ